MSNYLPDEQIQKFHRGSCLLCVYFLPQTNDKTSNDTKNSLGLWQGELMNRQDSTMYVYIYKTSNCPLVG